VLCLESVSKALSSKTYYQNSKRKPNLKNISKEVQTKGIGNIE
jgi:hypothetical protein